MMVAKIRKKARTQRTENNSRSERSLESRNESSMPETQQNQNQNQEENSSRDAQFKKPKTPPNARKTRSTYSRLKRIVRKSQTGNNETSEISSTSTGQSCENGTDSVVSGSVGDEDRLYDMVKNAQSTVDAIVDEWIEKYKVDREKALVVLIQFFIHASGCNGYITPEMLTDFNQVTIIQDMSKKFNEEDSVYPIIMPGQRGKEFQENFCEFIEVLVRQCQNSIIYDKYLMEHIILILIEMSDSEVRAFRHTATLAAMKVATALVDVSSQLFTNYEANIRQFDAEVKKAKGNRSIARLECLRDQRIELARNMDEVKEMFTNLMNDVFRIRCEDISPQIRLVCVEEIGAWMKEEKWSVFDSYLKYIGWLLNDEVAEIRLKCLMALQALFTSDESINKMKSFTKYFKNRIYAMTLDKDHNVVVQAIKLITKFSKIDVNEESYFTHEEFENICKLVYSPNRAEAVAAGEFLSEYLLQPGEQDNVTGQKTKRGKERLPNTPLIRHLVRFFIKSSLPQHAAYLVDALIDTNLIMKDWECMTDLLREETGPGEKELHRQEEIALIEIMFYCIKQTVTGEIPNGREHTNKNPTANAVKKMQSDKKKLTEYFIRKLPLVLKRHANDSKKLEKLLAIPQYFDLDVYVESRQENKLDSLLNIIQQIYMASTSPEVLNVAAKTFEHLCTEEHIIYDRCNPVRSTLVDNLMLRFKDNIGSYRKLVDEGIQPSTEETYSLVDLLKRISIFYECHNMNSHDIWESLYLIIKSTSYPSRSMPYEVIKLSIGTCFFVIMWSLHNVTMNSGAIDENACNLLNRRLHEFMELMQYLLESDCNREDHTKNLWGDAYNIICDLLVVFSNQMRTERDSAMHQLSYDSDQAMQNLLKQWLQKFVFVEDNNDATQGELDTETLRMRRHFLAGYCRLLENNMLPVETGVVVFKHYAKYHDIYGDLIKTTLGKLRESDRTNFALVVLQTLIALYNDKINERGAVTFHHVKKLVQRFYLLFGTNAAKNRDAITTLHKQGVLFAIKTRNAETYPNLPFLEFLAEFTNKLLKQDKAAMLNYLDENLTIGSTEDEAWKPLRIYRNSLLIRMSSQPVTDSQRSQTEDLDTEEQEVEGRGKGKRKRRLPKTHKGHEEQSKRSLRKTPLPVTKTPIQNRVHASYMDESIHTPVSSMSPEPVIEDASPQAHSTSDRSTPEIDFQFLSPARTPRADVKRVGTITFDDVMKL